jgi:hypothetical protein
VRISRVTCPTRSAFSSSTPSASWTSLRCSERDAPPLVVLKLQEPGGEVAQRLLGVRALLHLGAQHAIDALQLDGSLRHPARHLVACLLEGDRVALGMTRTPDREGDEHPQQASQHERQLRERRAHVGEQGRAWQNPKPPVDTRQSQRRLLAPLHLVARLGLQRLEEDLVALLQLDRIAELAMDRQAPAQRRVEIEDRSELTVSDTPAPRWRPRVQSGAAAGKPEDRAESRLELCL